MTEPEQYTHNTIFSRILVLLGVLQLLIGIAAVCFGPAELYCFYLFSEGGPFYYDGFGFGALMFGYIACQIIGYYVIAAVFIPLGYGHVYRRRWTLPLSQTLLWFWLIIGLPVIGFFIPAAASKQFSFTAYIVIPVLFVILLYAGIPGILLWFYNHRTVRSIFSRHDTRTYWLNTVPIPVLVLVLLLLFYVLIFHALIFFQCIFPFFGRFMTGFPGLIPIVFSIVFLLLVIYGILNRRIWAWYVLLAYFVLLAISLIVTFYRKNLADLLQLLQLPSEEAEILQNVTIPDIYAVLFCLLPLVFTIGLIIYTRPKDITF
ncbi:hypothetical protein ACFL6L_03890 [candidate division KSB1 bacterium]